ncbi:TPA: hypothetical protein DEP21_00485 [Patescibacteria group bacterium]|nr:hypothetical protein [Candidatus Gracilibacteria bacterium]
MIPRKDKIIIMIHFVGTFLNTSTPISNIFCHRAVDIARSIDIGINNQKYLLIDPRILGMSLVTALIIVCFLKSLS